METHCRLCGKVKRNLINILESSNENLKMKSLIYDVLRIKIHHCDGLPTTVCISCVAALQEMSAFINRCHRVQKVLKEKYELDCQDYLEKTEPALKTNSSSNCVPVPTEAEENMEIAYDEKHVNILEEHSIFVEFEEEPKKLTFIDSDELISEITSDPLESEYSTSDNVNENQGLLEKSRYIRVENEVTSNIEVIQNELTALPKFEVNGMSHSFDNSMNEEPIVKSEAVDLDDCFAPNPLEVELDETYAANLIRVQENINGKGNEKSLSTLKTVLPESTQTSSLAVPCSLNGEVHVESDQNCSSDRTNFLVRSNVSTHDIVYADDDKSTKTLLCVSLRRISESEYRQKSTNDLVCDTKDEENESDAHFTSNETNEDEIAASSTSLSCDDVKKNMKIALESVLTSQRGSKYTTLEKAHVGNELNCVEKGRQFFKRDAVKNYFLANPFLRQSNVSTSPIVTSSMVLDEFKTDVGEIADRKGGCSSNRKATNKLFNLCMRITENNISNFNYCLDKSRTECRISEQLMASYLSQYPSQNDTTNLNQSCSIDSMDLTTDEVGVPRGIGLVSDRNRAFFKCKRCGKKFMTRLLLGDHLRMHADIHPFKCELCVKTFRYRSHLTVHSRSVHSRGEFRCTLCDYVAKYERRLKEHLKMSHERPLFCSICDYRCDTKVLMEKHIISKHYT